MWLYISLGLLLLQSSELEGSHIEKYFVHFINALGFIGDSACHENRQTESVLGQGPVQMASNRIAGKNQRLTEHKEPCEEERYFEGCVLETGPLRGKQLHAADCG